MQQYFQKLYEKQVANQISAMETDDPGCYTRYLI